MRTRLVRNVNNVAPTTKYRLSGYHLSEKMKAYFRRIGLKTEDKTWSDVFPNADVVYRYNEDKGKSDVFVGEITTRIEGTRNRHLTSLNNIDLTNILWSPTQYRATYKTDFVIDRDKVKRLR